MAASNKTSVKYSNKTFEKGNSVHEAKFFKMMEKNVLDNRKTAEKRANKRKAKEPHERQYNEETVKALPTFKRWELLSPGVDQDASSPHNRKTAQIWESWLKS